MYFSHSRNGGGGDAGQRQPLYLHLQRVAELARSFGEEFGIGEQAEGTALLHDLGKYSQQFQRRLTDPNEPSRDHWSLGAFVACQERRPTQLLPAAAIAGHHVGLHSIASGRSSFKKVKESLNSAQSTTPDLDSQNSARRTFQDDGFTLPTFDCGLSPNFHRAADMLDTRMLFSTLVDADFLATEGHFEGDSETPYRPREPGRPLDAVKMRERLLDHLHGLHG